MNRENSFSGDLQDSLRDAIGRKSKIGFNASVLVETKPDKNEPRHLVLTDFRLYIMSPKPPFKVEVSIPFLDISMLESKVETKMVVIADTKKLIMSTSDEAEQIFTSVLNHIYLSLFNIFPSIPLGKLVPKIQLDNDSRWQQICSHVSDIGRKDQGACGNFSSIYRCMCDYHGLDFQEDVSWDVDVIFFSHDSKEMNLNEFNHLPPRFLLPIVSALERSSWFTKLNTSNNKLSPEILVEVGKVLKSNSVIEEVNLSNSGLRADSAQKLCTSLTTNTSCSLTCLDVSGNFIEDKGLNHLCSVIPKLSQGLITLNVARTGISAKGINRLSEALLGNNNIPKTLKSLDLSGNSVKGEDITILHNFLAQPNNLREFSIASSECSLENLFAAMLRGCVQNLSTIDLAGSIFSSKKSGKEVLVPISWKQFFSSTISLKSINLSNNRLPAEAFRNIFQGIESNTALKDLELNLSGCALSSASVSVLEACLPTVSNIMSLDISDNGFDQSLASIVGKLSQNKSLQKLSLGRNLNNIRPKFVAQVMEALVQLIHNENSSIRCLKVDNMKLKSDTTILINGLGINSTLTELDISGNQMGDIGARMLAKALQINKTLTVIYWDNNNTTAEGLRDVASALEKNYTMKKMPTPFYDASSAARLNQELTEESLIKITNFLERNHRTWKLDVDRAYRLEQCLLLQPSQQLMDKNLIQLRTLISKVSMLEKRGGALSSSGKTELKKFQALIKDAETSKTLLLQLHKVAMKTENSGEVDKQLGNIVQDLQCTLAKQLQTSAESMVECATSECQTVGENKSLHEELTAKSIEKQHKLPDNFLSGLIKDELLLAIQNRTAEINLSVASQISDRILDDIMTALEKAIRSLKDMLCMLATQMIKAGLMKDSDAECRELRASLKRTKSTSSEENDALSSLPESGEKHKSAINKRVRPQSVAAESIPGTGPAASTKEPAKEVSLDLTLSPDQPIQKLEHLALDRPRRLKTKAVTRPMVYSADDEDSSRGVSGFFDNKIVQGSSPAAVNGPPVNDKEVLSKSDKSEKSDKKAKNLVSPKVESKAESKGLGFKNFFSKKNVSQSSEVDSTSIPSEKSNASASIPPEKRDLPSSGKPAGSALPTPEKPKPSENGKTSHTATASENARTSDNTKAASPVFQRAHPLRKSSDKILEEKHKKTEDEKPKGQRSSFGTGAGENPPVAANPPAAAPVPAARQTVLGPKLPGMGRGIAPNLAELQQRRATVMKSAPDHEKGKPSEVVPSNPINIPGKGRDSGTELPNIESNGSEKPDSLNFATKVKPPPPLAPKPSKGRLSMISSSPPTSGSIKSGSILPVSRGLSEAESQSSDSSEHLDGKSEPPAAPVEAPKRRLQNSVREKAASIDRNSNVRSSGEEVTAQKSSTLPASQSLSASESPSKRPASDYSQHSSAASSDDLSGPPPVPTVPPPGDEDTNQSASIPNDVRNSDPDVLYI